MYMKDRDGQRQDMRDSFTRGGLNLGRHVGCTAADSASVYLFITDSAWVK